MKALSLWQPWASLIALGHKKHETRSWETLYRGPIAIHAAKYWTYALRNMCLERPFSTCLGNHWPQNDEFDPLPRGCIVAVADLVDCVRIDASTTPSDSNERAFGDYTPGRFRWDLANVRRLTEPVPCIGRQGLFNIDPAILPPEAR